MTVRLYRSGEAGAPQLGSLGSISSIFKACLATGFGSRTPAGWSVAFEDQQNYKIALQQGGASGRFLRIDNSEDYRFARVNGFATMSDIDTGTEGLFDENTYDGSPGGFFPGGSSSISDIRWTLIADERNVYFLVHYGWEHHVWVGYCGDVELTDPTNPYSFSMCAYTNSSDARSTSTGQTYSFLVASYTWARRIMRGLSQLEGVAEMRYVNRVTSDAGAAGYIGSCTGFTYPDIGFGGMISKPIELVDMSTKGYCGKLPIVLEPINYYHSGSSANRAYNRDAHHVISDNGNTYYLLGTSTGNGSLMFKVDVIDG